MWILVWVYLGYAGDLTTQIPFAAVKEVVLTSKNECEKARVEHLDVNDTRWMIANGQGRLVCVQLPGSPLE